MYHQSFARRRKHSIRTRRRTIGRTYPKPSARRGGGGAKAEGLPSRASAGARQLVEEVQDQNDLVLPGGCPRSGCCDREPIAIGMHVNASLSRPRSETDIRPRLRLACTERVAIDRVWHHHDVLVTRDEEQFVPRSRPHWIHASVAGDQPLAARARKRPDVDVHSSGFLR